MFTNCPYCRYLVALGSDGLPLPRCPNCARRLREDTPAEARAAQAEREEAEREADARATTDATEDAPTPAASAAGQTPADATAIPPSFATPGDCDDTEAVDDDAEAGSRNDVAASEPTAPLDAHPGTDSASPEIHSGAEDRVEDAASAPSQALEEHTSETHARDAAVAGDDALHALAAIDADPGSSVPDQAMDRALSDDGGDTAAPAFPASDADAPAPATKDTLDSIAVESLPQGPLQPGTDPAFATPIADEATPSADADTDGGADTGRDAAADSDSDAAPGWVAPSDQTSDTLASQPPPVDAPSRAAPNAAAQPRARPAAPSFARAAVESTQPTDKRRARLQLGAIAALALLLALQLAIADRARLAGDARWRPAVAALCGALRCSLPPWREPQAFALLQRNVQPHASIPGALRVTANFRNDARWPQPWPALLLTLSDVDGRETGTRIFSPREYLGAAPTQTMLESGQSAAIALDIREPSPQVVAFTFDFR